MRRTQPSYGFFLCVKVPDPKVFFTPRESVRTASYLIMNSQTIFPILAATRLKHIVMPWSVDVHLEFSLNEN